MSTPAPASAVPRLTYLRIKNYRALRDVEFRDLTPLTVLIGPNGSGKSTVLDALDFLSEAVSGNLTQAWEKRNRFAGMRTRGSEGKIEFEVEILIDDYSPAIRYELSIDEIDKELYVSNEIVLKKGLDPEKLLYLDSQISLINHKGDGARKMNFYRRDDDLDVIHTQFSSQPIISINFLTLPYHGQRETLAPKTLALAKILTSYRYLHLTDDHLKGYSDAGPRERLSPNGDNLPNVLYYLHLKHPDVLARIAEKLRNWVPGLAEVITEVTSDERLLLRFRDAPFEKPLPAQYMSGGTMRLAALLTLLYEPGATGLLGIEEPENELHPRLLPRLAEELAKATESRQLLVATHSPFLVDALEPEQVWILHRGADGYTQATRTADIPNVKELVEDGSPLGYLWTSNFFNVGDPLSPRNTAADAR